jgi:alpha-tubulin suppressor-like RCC1 family protein
MYGQLGDGTEVDRSVAVGVNSSGVLNGKVISGVGAGGFHSVVVSSDGGVFAWGCNNFGQIGDGTFGNRNVPVGVNMSGVLMGKRITRVAAGEYFTVVISSDGEVFSWGKNDNGELGDGTNVTKNMPIAVDLSGVISSKNIKEIAVGRDHTVVLSNDSFVFAWGSNGNGQLGDGTLNQRYVPIAVNSSGVLSGKVISHVSAGDSFTVVVSSDGKVFSWGKNDNGQLGDGTLNQQYVPIAVNTSGVLSGKIITLVSSGNSHTIVVSNDGQVFSWGNNQFGQLGDGSFNVRLLPVAVNSSGILSGKNISSVVGKDHTLVI